MPSFDEKIAHDAEYVTRSRDGRRAGFCENSRNLFILDPPPFPDVPISK